MVKVKYYPNAIKFITKSSHPKICLQYGTYSELFPQTNDPEVKTNDRNSVASFFFLKTKDTKVTAIFLSKTSTIKEKEPHGHISSKPGILQVRATKYVLNRRHNNIRNLFLFVSSKKLHETMTCAILLIRGRAWHPREVQQSHDKFSNGLHRVHSPVAWRWCEREQF